MKGTFRQAMGWLHTWVGLVVGWILFFMFLTGSAGYFDTEIDRWMQPERPLPGIAMPADKALGIALPAGAWELAGFDLTVAAFGIAFAIAAWQIRRRHLVDRRSAASEPEPYSPQPGAAE